MMPAFLIQQIIFLLHWTAPSRKWCPGSRFRVGRVELFRYQPQDRGEFCFLVEFESVKSATAHASDKESLLFVHTPLQMDS